MTCRPKSEKDESSSFKSLLKSQKVKIKEIPPAMRMSVVLILYSYLKLKSNYKLHIKV